MGHFDRIIGPILVNEGVNNRNPTGYADIPGDTGGVTKWGISTKAWNKLKVLFPERYNQFPSKTQDLTKEQALVIYNNEYYLPWFDKLDRTTAFLLMDCEVNQGFAARIVQRAIEAEEDGNVGPQTLAAIQRANRDIPKFNEEVIWQRLIRYKQINQPQFMNGWINRLTECRKVIKELNVTP